jgi:glycosyltransferase involved in cell wall biosynthesis
MKIALVVPGGVDRSGERRVIPAILALLKRLAARHEVHVFALAQEPLPGRWMLHGAHVHNIGRANAIAKLARTIRAIRREHRLGPFHVVHSVWAGACGFIAVCAARTLRLPSIVHVAGGELAALPQIAYGGRLTWHGRLLAVAVLRGATAITAASAPIVAQVEQLGERARRIPLGVDLEEWPSCAPAGREPWTQLRLVHVASLNRVKDQTMLLNAIARFATTAQDFHLDVIGEDTLGGEIQALATRLGLAQRIHFHGFLTQRQLRPIVARAHVNLVSSRHEAGPLVVLEAAALGVPTVGTAVGHIAEWAGSAAQAVPVGDALGLAHAIGKMARDEPMRLKIAEEGRQRATSQDADYTCAQFEQLYAELKPS